MGKIRLEIVKGIILFMKDLIKGNFLKIFNLYTMIFVLYSLLLWVGVGIHIYLIALVISFIGILVTEGDIPEFTVSLVASLVIVLIGINTSKETELSRITQKVYIPSYSSELHFEGKTENLDTHKWGVYEVTIIKSKTNYLGQDTDLNYKFEFKRLETEGCSVKFVERVTKDNRVYEYSNDDICPSEIESKFEIVRVGK